MEVHTQIEEEIFHPAFREAAHMEQARLGFELLEEHHLVDLVRGTSECHGHGGRVITGRAGRRALG